MTKLGKTIETGRTKTIENAQGNYYNQEVILCYKKMKCIAKRCNLVETIKDCLGRTICMMDLTQGKVEIKYRHLFISFTIEDGSSFSIFREGVTTCITRENDRCYTASCKNKHY